MNQPVFIVVYSTWSLLAGRTNRANHAVFIVKTFAKGLYYEVLFAFSNKYL